jgi:hypothetical protein
LTEVKAAFDQPATMGRGQSQPTVVVRWQGNTGLAWSDDDIIAVTRYLNDLYYRFPAPGSPVALRRPLLRACVDVNPSSTFAGARKFP